jgi:alkaline phosphatase
MNRSNLSVLRRLLCGAVGVSLGGLATIEAAPSISRLTPPSGLFAFGDPNPPIISRFIPNQRFDLQATVRPDTGQSIVGVEFLVNGSPVGGSVALAPATVAGLPAGTMLGTRRAFSVTVPGIHLLTVRATQSDGAVVTAQGNFEVVALSGAANLAKARNVIFLIGDGMGIAHRTAARIMLHGVSQGKSLAPLAMDQFPVTGLLQTASLNSIVTDSSPGAAIYANGNKANNNQQGVFPDDTTDNFDNPRVELIGEFLSRTLGKSLGIVTTSDVFDATPGAFGTHTANRGAGTGICDQYLDEAASRGGLRVLLGGGRKWFLPSTTPGSARSASNDYVLPVELATGWGVPRGSSDPSRDLLADFQAAGFTYTANATQLRTIPAATDRLLGLYSLSNMNVALDKIAKRRGQSSVVDDYGFPDQPMLDEMTAAALQVLSRNPNGFVLMVEAASIDKQAHNMDTERWILDTIEFDRAIERVRQFVIRNPDTLAIITADHECAGVNIIGASTVTDASLKQRAEANGGAAQLRDSGVVGLYEAAGFPYYKILTDGYPETTDVDRRMLIGYAGNSDRNEDWRTNARPLRDSQQPLNGQAPLNTYPADPLARDAGGGFRITGQVPGSSAVHTASDIPLSAMGAGAGLFTGSMDNTDVFFRAMQAVLNGAPVAVEAPSIGQRTAGDRLTNLSSRAFVGGNDAQLIGGFVVTGSRSRQVLIRAVGPGLTGFGVANALADPLLTVMNAAGAPVASNDSWSTDSGASAVQNAMAQVGAFALAAGSRDAALVVTLNPGQYSARVTGVDGATGTALLEVYELP